MAALAGFVGQTLLLGVLEIVTGIGWAGWATGMSYGLVLSLALRHGLSRVGATGLGAANGVTLSRATLVGGVTALVAASFTLSEHDEPVGLIVGITTVALILDAVDGQVARRSRTASGLGARFDMEVDAFLILVLSVYVARSLGWWVVAIGAMRYAYVAAGWLLPRLRRPVPPRYWRKVVAATEGIVLTVAASGLVGHVTAVTAVAVALTLLVESFGRDIVWQWRQGPAGEYARKWRQ